MTPKSHSKCKLLGTIDMHVASTGNSGSHFVISHTSRRVQNKDSRVSIPILTQPDALQRNMTVTMQKDRFLDFNFYPVKHAIVDDILAPITMKIP